MQRLIDINGLKAIVQKIDADIKAKAAVNHTHAPADVVFDDGKDLAAKIAEIVGGQVNLDGYATQEYVNGKIADLVGEGTPEALDTLKELAAALNGDGNFAATMVQELAKKVDKEEGKVLIAQTEVDRLAGLQNYDDTAIAGRVTALEAIDHSQFLKEIPAEYVTSEELAAEGFLKEHQDISNLATKAEVQTVDAKIGVQAVEAAEGVDPVEATGLYKYVDDKVAAVEFEVATTEELIAMYEEVKNPQE